MTIKYLVFSGGGAGGLVQYGAIRHLSKNNFFDMKNIKSIYGTSAGALLATLIILDSDWNTLDDYLIKRPWENLTTIRPDNLINIFREKGILNIDIIKKIINPFLTVNNLSEDITLKEFYEYSQIEFYLYTVNINDELPKMMELSYKSHPELELYRAIGMSLAIPLLFQPIYYDNGCYIDGAFLNNFPLNECINRLESSDENEILAFNIKTNKTINSIENDTALHYYLFFIFNKMRHMITNMNKSKNIKNIINCYNEKNNMARWHEAWSNQNIREEMVKSGDEAAKQFLQGELQGETPHTPINNP